MPGLGVRAGVGAATVPLTALRLPASRYRRALLFFGRQRRSGGEVGGFLLASWWLIGPGAASADLRKQRWPSMAARRSRRDAVRTRPRPWWRSAAPVVAAARELARSLRSRARRVRARAALYWLMGPRHRARPLILEGQAISTGPPVGRAQASLMRADRLKSLDAPAPTAYGSRSLRWPLQAAPASLPRRRRDPSQRQDQ